MVEFILIPEHIIYDFSLLDLKLVLLTCLQYIWCCLLVPFSALLLYKHKHKFWWLNVCSMRNVCCNALFPCSVVLICFLSPYFSLNYTFLWYLEHQIVHPRAHTFFPNPEPVLFSVCKYHSKAYHIWILANVWPSGVGGASIYSSEPYFRVAL